MSRPASVLQRPLRAEVGIRAAIATGERARCQDVVDAMAMAIQPALVQSIDGNANALRALQAYCSLPCELSKMGTVRTNAALKQATERVVFKDVWQPCNVSVLPLQSVAYSHDFIDGIWELMCLLRSAPSCKNLRFGIKHLPRRSSSELIVLSSPIADQQQVSADACRPVVWPGQAVQFTAHRPRP